MSDGQPLTTKGKGFALRMVEVYRDLAEQCGVYIVSKQRLRSGTGTGADIAEAQYAQSKEDFVSTLSVA